MEIKTKMIGMITGRLESSHSHYEYLNNTSRRFDIKGLQKYSCWALLSYTDIEVTKGLSWEITLHVPYMVTTE